MSWIIDVPTSTPTPPTPPGGNPGDIQFNNGGVFGGEALVPLAHGGTNANLSATGGTHFVLRQSTIGGAITVSQLDYSDLSGTPTINTWAGLTGTLTNGQVIPYADAGISRLAAGSLAIGNGTAGDYSGALTLGTLNQTNPTVATISTTNASPVYTLSANYWTGSASSVDTWSLQSSLAAGANGLSTLTLVHSGSNLSSFVVAGVANDMMAFKNSAGTITSLSLHRNSNSAGVIECCDGTTSNNINIYAGDQVVRMCNVVPVCWTSSATNAALAQDAGISRLGAASLAIGNGTAGDFSGSLKLTTINAVTGYQINGAATLGHVLRGDGTNFVDAQLQYADIGGTVPTPPSGSVLWSALGNAGADLSLSNAGFKTTFNQTSAVAWLWANTTVATISSVNASPLLELAANYWTAGSASAQDLWTVGSSLAAGANGISSLTFAHSGSTGKAQIKAPALNLAGYGDSSGATLGFIFARGLLSPATSGGSDYKIYFDAAVTKLALSSDSILNWTGGAATAIVDCGISRLGAASLAIGNGTAGDFTGLLKLTGLNNQGGSIVNRATKAAGYTTTATDYVLSFTATATLVLDSAAAVSGTTYRIKLSASATAGAVLTVAPNNSKTIDGAATLIMSTLGQAVDVVYNSVTNDWQIF